MESPHDTNTLRYFSSDLFHKVIKSKIFIKCKGKSKVFYGLPVENLLTQNARSIINYLQ